MFHTAFFGRDLSSITIEFWWQQDIPDRPDRPQSPDSHLYSTVDTSSLLWVKWPERGTDHQPPSVTEVANEFEAIPKLYQSMLQEVS
jgi:hypothetical protein